MSVSRKLKIVHLDTGQELRGGQRQLLLLARGLDQRGHSQLIVCLEKSALETRARLEGFEVFSLPAHDPAHAHGLLQLRQYLRTTPFEILHAHDGRAQTLAWLASAGMDVRRVATRRVTFLPRDRWTYSVKYKYTCQAVVAVSRYIRRLLMSAGVPESTITVIPDGIEISAVLPLESARSQIRAQWGFAEADFVVGHLGAFTAEKGQDLALDALVLLEEKLPQARLVLAGDGPTKNSPQIRQKAESARARVRLCDSVESLMNFFPGLDLYIMPSRSEGLGSSALLAMAYGLPVVASEVGGLPEIVAEGETGWLAPALKPAALADAIVMAASDRARLSRYGQRARERAREFSADIMIARTEALYERMLF